MIRKLRRWISCNLFRTHAMKKIGEPSPYSGHYRCQDCSREFGWNYATGIILPWHRCEVFYLDYPHRDVRPKGQLKAVMLGRYRGRP